MTTLQGRTIFITGGSRGIGKAIALRAAKDGANIVIAARTAEPHPKLHRDYLYSKLKKLRLQVARLWLVLLIYDRKNL